MQNRDVMQTADVDVVNVMVRGIWRSRRVAHDNAERRRSPSLSLRQVSAENLPVAIPCNSCRRPARTICPRGSEPKSGVSFEKVELARPTCEPSVAPSRPSGFPVTRCRNTVRTIDAGRVVHSGFRRPAGCLWRARHSWFAWKYSSNRRS